MKPQRKLSMLIKGQSFDGYLYVRSAKVYNGTTGNYLDMYLCDNTGGVRAKMWNTTIDAPAPGTVIFVHAKMDEYSGKFRTEPRLTVKTLRLTGSNDDYDIDELKPREAKPKPAVVETPAAEAAPTPAPAPAPAPAPVKRVSSLSELKDGDRFEGFLLVRAVDQRTDKNGRPYLDMTLCDANASISAKAFAKALGNCRIPSACSVLYVTGTRQTYNNTHVQLILDTMRLAEESDEFDMSLLVACAPYPAKEMRTSLYARANAIRSDDLRRLVVTRLDQCGDKLDYYPAASRLHHAEKGGLLHHTTTMLKMAEHVCEVYPQLDADLVAAGVILHDLCKLEEMNADIVGVVSEYTAYGNLIGHLVAGVAELDRIGRELRTDPELLMMLEHMILSHHDLPEYGSPKPPMFPEAEVLHTLDLLDARMFEMDRELKNALPGSFTERVWSLDRKLYRRKDRR